MNKLVNFLSLNVGTSNILAGLPALVNAENLDILFLQEVKLSSKQIESLMPGFRADSNIDSENPDAPGTAIVWRNNLKVKSVTSIVMCRLQVATLGSYRLVNIYAPSGSNKKREREQFFGQTVFDLLQLTPKLAFIWAGDFNCILDKKDVENSVGFQQKISHSLDTLVKTAGLVDSFRSLYPYKLEFTFFRPGSAASRLDKFYISSCLLVNVSTVDHIASLSDHCGVKMGITLHDEAATLFQQSLPKRTSYWKLNTAILQEENFLEMFKPF